MKPKSILLATLLVFMSACDGGSKVDACVMVFNQTTQCHQQVLKESCWVICEEMLAICNAANETPINNDGCNEAYNYCGNRCFSGFYPDDPTALGQHPERTDYFYRLDSCATPDEQEMICSDLTDP